MASHDAAEEMKILYDTLMPILSRAAIGEFDGEIPLDPANSQRVNELLAGVYVLLEVIQQKIGELEASNARLSDATDRSLALVDEMLLKSQER
ncbi:MAG TPA: hypothetical protein VHQ86_03830 [Candidatus Saccharimonadia bacterium]|jgi:hypothetical protein|nr:hypothetical protein [Candidatus Saccharimonadia bacterium]